MTWKRAHAWAVGLALILATNAVVLGGVWYDRSGVDSRLVLTQRELQPMGPSYAGREDSGLELKLQWRILPPPGPGEILASWDGPGLSPAWLDEAKMASLGYDVTLPDAPGSADPPFRRQPAREVYLVLELDGPLYREALDRATRAAEREEAKGDERARYAAEFLRNARETRSRVFVADAGVDRAALRAKFSDPARYAIVRGEVAPGWGDAARPHSGVVRSVHGDVLDVPLGLRPVFERAGPSRRFEAVVVFGRRLESHLESATPR